MTVRTTLTILRLDATRNAYRVEPRPDALPRVAQRHNLPLEQLRDESTHWFLPQDALTQPYGKGATTPACEVDRIEHEGSRLVIWMKPAPRKEQGNS